MVCLRSTITEVDAVRWNRLTGENPFATHDWLCVVERHWRVRFEPIYLTLEEGGEPRASAVAYVVEANAKVETLDDLLLGRLRAPATRLGLSFQPALVCGPAQGYGWHIGVDPRLNPAARDAARREMVAALEAEADRRGLPLAFPQVLDEQPELVDLLVERGYLASRNVPIATLDLCWPTLEDYFKSLPSKRRREFRRERRRNLDAGVVIEPADPCEDAPSRLHALLEGNALRHGSAGLPFEPGALSSLGQGGELLVARKDGELVGAFVTLRAGATSVAYAVGVDPERAGADFTYFNLCYYTPIERAIAAGLRRLYFGRGMYPVKVRRGCRLIGSSIYLRVSPLRAAVCRPWLFLASAWNRGKLPKEARAEVASPRNRVE